MASSVAEAETAPLFAALGDETRLRLVSRLSGIDRSLEIATRRDGVSCTRGRDVRRVDGLLGQRLRDVGIRSDPRRTIG